MGKKENKTHIGFFLNLDKPSDRAINHILETIPSYVSKTSYIKRAIMFYKKHCNDDIEISDNMVSNIGSEETPSSFQPAEAKNQKSRPTSEVKADSKKKNNNIIEEAVASKVENEIKQEMPKEDNSNDLIVTNNSDIDENIDYDELVNGFFTS